MFDFTTGPVARPQRTVVYGPEGVGKSTFASLWPDPVFIDTERGTDALDVARTEATGWEDLMGLVRDFAAGHGRFRTLVIDTADGAETMCRSFVLARDGKPSIESYGYGKGYAIVAEEWARLLAALDDVALGAKPADVVVCAHSQLRKFELPEEAGAFDKYELKCDRRVAALTKEWADAVLFLNYKTLVVDVDGRKKARGKERTLYAEHAATFDAKNRWGLPEETPLDGAFAMVAPHLGGGASPAPATPAPTADRPEAAPTPSPAPTPDDGARGELARLMAEAGLDGAAVRAAMADRGYRPYECPIADYPDQLVEWMVGADVWPQLADFARANPNPF